MFKNLIDWNGNRIPPETCNHRGVEECMCDCHDGLRKEAHITPCCVDCPYCKKRVPIRYYRISPF